MADPKPKRLFDIRPTEPDLATREKFSWMKGSMLPKAVQVQGIKHTTFKWTGEMLYVSCMNMVGERFWTEAALGWLKPKMFAEAVWVEVPLSELGLAHDAPFRYRD